MDLDPESPLSGLLGPSPDLEATWGPAAPPPGPDDLATLLADLGMSEATTWAPAPEIPVAPPRPAPSRPAPPDPSPLPPGTGGSAPLDSSPLWPTTTSPPPPPDDPPAFVPPPGLPPEAWHTLPPPPAGWSPPPDGDDSIIPAGHRRPGPARGGRPRRRGPPPAAPAIPAPHAAPDVSPYASIAPARPASRRPRALTVAGLALVGVLAVAGFVWATAAGDGESPAALPSTPAALATPLPDGPVPDPALPPAPAPAPAPDPPADATPADPSAPDAAAPAPPGGEPGPQPVPSGDSLAAADRAAQAFVAAVNRRDCEAVWASFSFQSQQALQRLASDQRTSAKQALCASLGSEDFPAIALVGPVEPAGPGLATARLEADGAIEPIWLVLEGGRWAVDALMGVSPEPSGA